MIGDTYLLPLKPRPEGQKVKSPVAVEKLFRPKIAKIKLRQDAL